MNAALLQAILTNGRRGQAMARVLRALLEGGPRSRNVVEAVARQAGTFDKMLLAGMIEKVGDKRGTQYAASKRVRSVARQVPELNPA